jgi:hypothetical protein
MKAYLSIKELTKLLVNPRHAIKPTDLNKIANVHIFIKRFLTNTVIE